MDSREKTLLKKTEIGMIPENWKVNKLVDVCDEITDGSHFSPKEDPNGKQKIASVKDFSEHGFDITECKNISEVEFEKLRKSGCIPEKGDILISKDGTMGIVYVSRGENIALLSSIAILKPKKDVDSNFLGYFLKDKRTQHDLISNYSSGSALPRIVLKDLKELLVALPRDNKSQETIAKILSSFDSKIELNQQMNKTLEAVGQAVFKHWFVDFEFPNEEGKPYKSSGGEVVDSTLGEIPSGWKTGGLGDICEITMGQSPPGETYNEISKGVPFFQGIRDFGFRFPSKRVYCVAPTRFAQEGDVLLSVRAPVGSLNIADVRCAIGRGVAALRLKGKQNSFLYYLLLATRSAWDQYDAKGTVFGSATKQDVHDFKIIIPPKDLRDQFSELIGPLDQKILLNEKESRNLTAVRDSLLPRLMSGKIRVPVQKENAEAQ